jgi:putative SOS response-associated peptidase YedK
MCGRYSLFTSAADLADRFDVAEPELDPSYNCAPGQNLPVVAGDSPDSVSRKRWGFVPADARDDADGHINARAETIREKPSFRDAFERRRCLVLADGFYEWVPEDGGKRPYRVAFADDRPFAMAGIWERWTPETTQTGLGEFGDGDPDRTAEPVETFAVVTTDPNDLVSELHHRMAVILSPEEEETWLTGGPDEASSLLDPHPADEMTAYPVSTRVNDPRNDDPSLVDPVSDGAQA